jgi:hypothetical protein
MRDYCCRHWKPSSKGTNVGLSKRKHKYALGARIRKSEEQSPARGFANWKLAPLLFATITLK